MKKRKLLKRLSACLLAFLIVIAAQFICFYRILLRSGDAGTAAPRADMIAVFRGAQGRVVKGFELANNGAAPLLVISPSSRTNLMALDRRYRRSRQFEYLPEPRADTTFQNALFVSRLMETHRKRSVILVTSDYHMPRSYLLLWIELLGTGATIRPCPVETGRFPPNPLAWSTRRKKQIYNEMVEFWGSLFELGRYHLLGSLPAHGLKKSAPVSFLRELLLFEV